MGSQLKSIQAHLKHIYFWGAVAINVARDHNNKNKLHFETAVWHKRCYISRYIHKQNIQRLTEELGLKNYNAHNFPDRFRASRSARLDSNFASGESFQASSSLTSFRVIASPCSRNPVSFPSNSSISFVGKDFAQ
jgi:hypothetical protein